MENYWPIYGLFACIVIPFMACISLISNFFEVHQPVPSCNRKRDAFTAWGITTTLSIVWAPVRGSYRGEWRGASSKVYALMCTGLSVSIEPSFMTGISSS